MLYSKAMMFQILGVAAALKDCADDCTVPGSIMGRLSTERWTSRTQLCDADHVWNYAELGPQAGFHAKAWGQTNVRCKDGKLISSPGVGGSHPHVSTRLCLNKSHVDAREQNLGKLFDTVLKEKIEAQPRSRMNIIARATASRRHVVTGAEQDTVEWDNMVVAMRQYFEEDIPRRVNGRLDVSQVQRYAVFKGMQIMPDQNEGHYALKALAALSTSGTDDLSMLIQQKVAAGKLVAMEQGGRSLQIWPGQDLDNDVYPEETGLYSNLGNDAIKEQLVERNPNTSCLNPVVKEHEKANPPPSYFSKDACRAELKALTKHRHDSNSEGMPKLVQDGLYVAFSTFYYAAKRVGIHKQVMPVREALSKVQEYLALEDAAKCPEGLVADQHPYAPAHLLCMQVLVLEMMLQEMVDKSQGIEADIVFHNEVNGKDISWTVGVAEEMKPTVNPGQQIVVLDLGSTSTKMYGMTNNGNGTWSDMTRWTKIKGGDILQSTAPDSTLRI